VRDLGEREHENQVEEELERSYPVLSLLACTLGAGTLRSRQRCELRRRTRRRAVAEAGSRAATTVGERSSAGGGSRTSPAAVKTDQRRELRHLAAVALSDEHMS
jgi:hypothetical protein